MSDGNHVQAVRLPRRGTGKPLGRNARSCGAATAWSPGTAPGTTSSNSRRAPTAPAAPRCAAAASPPRPTPRPNWTWPASCWPSPPPGDPEHRHPDRRRHHRVRQGHPHAARPGPGPQGRSAAATTPPSARPPSASGWRNGWPPRRSCGPAPCAATPATSGCTYQPHLGHIPIDRLRVTDVASVFDAHRGTQRRHHRSPRQRRPRPAGRGQGTPPGRPGHLPADPRHPALGDQHLHETAPRRAARQRRLARRAAAGHPAQGPGLDRRARPGLAARLRRPARRRPRRRRAGQPASTSGSPCPARRRSWSGPPPRPWSSSPPPAATGCTRCGG